MFIKRDFKLFGLKSFCVHLAAHVSLILKWLSIV